MQSQGLIFGYGQGFYDLSTNFPFRSHASLITSIRDVYYIYLISICILHMYIYPIYEQYMYQILCYIDSSKLKLLFVKDFRLNVDYIDDI